MMHSKIQEHGEGKVGERVFRRGGRRGKQAEENMDKRDFRHGGGGNKDNELPHKTKGDEEIVSNFTESAGTFEEMKLKDTLLRGIYNRGFTTPSVIQQRGILPIAKGRDLVAQAQSGTGKTLTFTVGALQIMDETNPALQVLILVPVRELAIDHAKIIRGVGEFMRVGVRACVGGYPVWKDTEALRGGNIQVVVGTPGRVLDLIERNILDVSCLKIVCFDEADEMLSRNFNTQIIEIASRLKEDLQYAFLSATMPTPVLKQIEKVTRDPVKIVLKSKEVTLDGIAQYKVELEEENVKPAVLVEILQHASTAKTYIFSGSIARAKWIHDFMEKKFPKEGVAVIHSDMSMEARQGALRAFRDGKCRIIVSTDLLGRGIDVHDVHLVINYDLRRLQPEMYVHRIGRVGRFGRKGIAINLLACKEEYDFVKEIERNFLRAVVPLPELKDIFGGS